VLAMLQARLSRLDPGARRVLRAASVFGVTFWRGGVDALVGRSRTAEQVDEALRVLTEAELIVRHESSRFTGEVEYAFRHALMRDAAYSMLSDEDRAAAHCAAGRYLEAAGEGDPMVLGEHYARGQDAARAGRHYARAAEQAHVTGDASAVIALAEKALEQELAAPARAMMLALIAEEHGWRSDFRRAFEVSEEVRRLSAPGSLPWATAVAPGLFGARVTGQRDAANALLEQLCEVRPEPSAFAKVAFGMQTGSYWCTLDAQVELGARLVERQRELVEPLASEEPLAYGWNCVTRSLFNAIADEGPAAARSFGATGREVFQALGHRRGELAAEVFIGKALFLLGQMEEAEQTLRRTFVAGVAYGPIEMDRIPWFIEVLLARGAVEEAERTAQEALGPLARRHEIEVVYEGALRAGYANVLCQQGELERAEGEARAACELLGLLNGPRLWGLATLGAIVLRRGGAEEALRLADEVLAAHEALRFFGPSLGRAWLLRAEALRALGDSGGSRAALEAGRGALMSRATRIGDEGLRRGFLRGVSDHARLLDLAEAAG